MPHLKKRTVFPEKTNLEEIFELADTIITSLSINQLETSENVTETTFLIYLKLGLKESASIKYFEFNSTFNRKY